MLVGALEIHVGRPLLAGEATQPLYDVDLRSPVLTFSDPDMPERIATLREQGHRFVERLPRGMNPLDNALLEAPEGTWLLLTTDKVSGLQDVQDSLDAQHSDESTAG